MFTPAPKHLMQAILESFIDGIMLVTVQGQILEANVQAQQICHHLDDRAMNSTKGQLQLPAEIWRICEALIESRKLFPDQRIVPESEITLASGIRLRIRVRWLEWNGPISDGLTFKPPYLLITLENRQQTLLSVALSDIRRYHLTPSEGKIWQLRLQGYSYQEIAHQLFITQNTVKKHIKSILAKRRDTLDQSA
jgi:DNA-binding CsgD family transcriptional regulator